MTSDGRRQSRRLLSDSVREGVLALIHEEHMSVGTKIPGESELSERFQVSRATIREAVGSLVEAGYLSRVHGSGTFVAFRPRLRHTLERNLSYSDLISQAGLRPGRTFLGMERGEVSGIESELLLVPANEPVVRIERVRSADGQPVIYSIDTIPERYVKDRPISDMKGSLYELFNLIGCTIAHGEATLEPVLADLKLAECLEVDVGSPLLRIFQVDYTTAGEPVMFSREWHVPGVFELSLLRRST